MKATPTTLLFTLSDLPDALPPTVSGKMYPVTPLERLRLALTEDKRRGVPFDEAWASCVSRILAAEPGRATWGEIFEWSRETWGRCYRGERRQTVDYLSEGLPVLEGVVLPSGERVEVLA